MELCSALAMRQGLEWHPGAAEADIFVGGRRLTKEDPAPPTKIQPVQVGYNGKPGSAAQKKRFSFKEPRAKS